MDFQLTQAVLVIAIAAYRIAHMIAVEDGPFDAFAKLRNKVDPMQSTWVGRGINCPLCISFWVAIVLTAMYMYLPWLVVALSASGVALIIHRKLYK